MEIEKYIKTQAPEESSHDRSYAMALRSAYNLYNSVSLGILYEAQISARQESNGTHRTVAKCMIIQKLINEKENK